MSKYGIHLSREYTYQQYTHINGIQYTIGILISTVYTYQQYAHINSIHVSMVYTQQWHTHINGIRIPLVYKYHRNMHILHIPIALPEISHDSEVVLFQSRIHVANKHHAVISQIIISIKEIIQRSIQTYKQRPRSYKFFFSTL